VLAGSGEYVSIITHMKIDFISIFPEMFGAYFNESIMKRAAEKRLIKVKAHDLRKWASGKHHKVDDRPFGGGPGMVMMAEPFVRAIKTIARTKHGPRTMNHSTRKILMAASGKTFNHKDAVRLAKYKHLIFLCPRYEGVDARVEKFIDEKISIGDYVLTGGELPAMVVADAVVRHIPGALGKAESLVEESHTIEGLTEYPQYTRPEVFQKMKVPAVLLSGDHGKIAEWRKEKMGRNQISND
jgi:tRNA (guanine37-N1)-methyltransferase